MPSNFVTENYDKMVQKRVKLDSFFQELEDQLSSISAPDFYHMDISWSNGEVRRSTDGARIQGLPMEQRLKYYNQAFGLMKLAINNQLYPE